MLRSPRRATSRASVLIACSLALAPLAGAQAAFDPSKSDARAVAIADQVIAALGGAEAWNATRFLRFDFEVEREGKSVVRRAHTWDKWNGRYRLELQTREGKTLLVVMNLNTREGTALLDGRAQSGDDSRKSLDQAFAVWVNDTYWLLMPYKLKDPGVSLALDGAEKNEKGEWDKLRLTFESVGLTPKDKYWAYVNKATHLVDRWDFVLKGEDKPPTPFDWKGWKSYGRIKLADDRVNPQDGTRIFFPVLDAPASLPDEVFNPPAAAPGP